MSDSPPRIIQATALYTDVDRAHMGFVDAMYRKRLADLLAAEVAALATDTPYRGQTGYWRKHVELVVCTPEQYRYAIERAALRLDRGLPDPLIF